MTKQAEKHLEQHIVSCQPTEFRINNLLSTVLKLLPAYGTVLDYGAGNGLLVNRLIKRPAVSSVFASEVSDGTLTVLRSIKNITVIDGRQSTKLPTNTFDCIYSLDVIEHIEDDQATLSEFFTALKPGGKVCLAVPAHQYLFSDFDRSIGHFRRYSFVELATKLQQAGFIIEKQRFWNRLGYLIVNHQVQHRLQRPDATGANKNLKRGLPNLILNIWFRLIENNFPTRAGLTLIIVAHKS